MPERIAKSGSRRKSPGPGDGWLPRMPNSLEDLDLLLISVAKARTVHRDGIHFQGIRYMDPTLAAYVKGGGHDPLRPTGCC